MLFSFYNSVYSLKYDVCIYAFALKIVMNITMVLVYYIIIL